MPSLKLPLKEYWDVSYENDRAATIIEAFNLDLHRYKNKAGTSSKIWPHTVTSDIAAITAPKKFLYSNWDGGYKYTAIADKVYKTSSIGTVFAADTKTSSPTSMGDTIDAVVHGRTSGLLDILVVATGTNLARYNADISATTWETAWWTDTVANGGLEQSALSSSFPTILKVFGNAPTLFILNGLSLHSIGTPGTSTTPTAPSDVTANRLVFKSGYYGAWMATTSDRVFIGLTSSNGQGAPSLIEEYDPFTERVREYVIQEGETRGYVYGNQLVVIDYKGNVREFNGSDFPISCSLPTASIQEASIGLPHRNGFAVYDGMPQFLIGSAGTSYLGGIWEYNPMIKRIYHRTSMSKSLSFGEGYINGSWGALFCEANVLFAGVSLVDQPSSGEVTGVFSNQLSNTVHDTTLQFNYRSYLVTGKVSSNSIDNLWRNVLAKYNPRPPRLGTTTGPIIVKYRTADSSLTAGSIYDGTWVSTTTFTTSTANAAKIEIGNEIQIIRGRGSGFMAHALLKSAPAAGLVTVTIDEAFPATITGAFSFIINNWVKIPQTITSTSKMSEVIDIPVGNPGDISATLSNNPSEWVQLKIEIRDSFYLEELQIGYQPNLLAEEVNVRN